jgi:hypothetical protein
LWGVLPLNFIYNYTHFGIDCKGYI